MKFSLINAGTVEVEVPCTVCGLDKVFVAHSTADVELVGSRCLHRATQDEAETAYKLSCEWVFSNLETEDK